MTPIIPPEKYCPRCFRELLWWLACGVLIGIAIAGLWQ